MARTRVQWKTVQPFRPTIGNIRWPPQHLRRRVMELNGTCDPAGDRRRAVFAQELCRQFDGHFLQLIADNDRLEAQLRQSRKIISQLRRGLRESKR